MVSVWQAAELAGPCWHELTLAPTWDTPWAVEPGPVALWLVEALVGVAVALALAVLPPVACEMAWLCWSLRAPAGWVERVGRVVGGSSTIGGGSGWRRRLRTLAHHVALPLAACREASRQSSLQ